MSQNWIDDVFALSHEGETDLQNLENNFQCLRTLFSGASFSLNTDPGHPWYDSSTPILGEGLLKIRKQGDDGWLGVLALAQESDNGLVWFHGDDLSNQEGWVIDIKITEDRVMALKNHGSGTYTQGRQALGQWAITGIDNEGLHTHTVLNHTHNINHTQATGSGVGFAGNPDYGVNYARAFSGSSGGTSPGTTAGSNHKHTQDGTWRIKAQVGIVIYPDI